MNIEAFDYNRTNRHQANAGIDLINKINCQHLRPGDDYYIVDIGCGDGKLTAMLNKHLNGQHLNGQHYIFGVDIDQKMIDFAKQNNTEYNNNIEYFGQDFGVEWSQLKPELKAMEGKVSVIFSNMTLHWIYTKRQNVAQNMNRLLAKNGKIYLNIFRIPNKYSKLEGSFSSVLDLFGGVPTNETQHLEWTECFNNIKFDIIEDLLFKQNVFYEVNEFDNYVSPMIWPMCQQFYNFIFINGLKLVSNLLRIKPSNHLKTFRDESTGKMMCEIQIEYFQYIMNKTD